ncbi:TraR/DksA C4-type zinc finger protein [Undibacterium jejuense]|uniref:TraR/DksA C4-type zinc finger protein n=1 Tax=Undibacterium jejuense TaxID=1344949 RepID=A0A923HBP3_9BURK|nr:TraR/DksA C4-type zinc finger protein [Undibacterium jejuense]MBC3860986.1 TraR/DksA C4-type zinc finger protein [Undibacterium jejuense]
MSLNNEQQAALKSKLDLMKQEIQTELRQHNPDLLRHDSGEGDGAINDVLNHDAMSKYLHQHAEWQSLQRAQARLSENIADICRECGATIPYARLEAEPTAERCIKCQSALEADDQRLRIHSHSSM